MTPRLVSGLARCRHQRALQADPPIIFLCISLCLYLAIIRPWGLIMPSRAYARLLGLFHTVLGLCAPFRPISLLTAYEAYYLSLGSEDDLGVVAQGHSPPLGPWAGFPVPLGAPQMGRALCCFCCVAGTT